MDLKTLAVVAVAGHIIMEVMLLVVVSVVPVSFSSPILHKYTQGYIPINNKNIYSL
jgi:hypothetical protein